MAIDVLSPRQAKLLEVLMNPDNYKKTVTELCVIAEISRHTYYDYFKDPIFIKALEKAREDILKSAVLPLINKSIREAKGKSFNDRKLVLEMAGAYKQHIDVTERVIVVKGDDKLDGI